MVETSQYRLGAVCLLVGLGLLVAPSACRAPHKHPASQPQPAQSAADPPPVAADQPAADEPETATTHPAHQAAEALVRAVLVPAIRKGLEDPATHIVFEGEPLRVTAEDVAGPPLTTFYFGRYAVDLPAGAFDEDGARVLTFEDGGLLVRLRSGLRVTVYAWPQFLLNELRETAIEMLPEDETWDEIERLSPGYMARFREQTQRAFGFESDHALRCRLYADAFEGLRLDEMSIPELFETFTLVELKAISCLDGDEHGVQRVQTPHFEGIAYGVRLTYHRLLIGLSDDGLDIEVSLLCRPGPLSEIPDFERTMRAVLASLRRHGSATPGADQLATARRLHAMNAERDDLAPAVRLLALCAARYDDAYAEAVEFGRTLVPSDWPPERTESYLELLTRTNWLDIRDGNKPPS